MARKHTDYIIIHCAATRPSHEVDIADIDRWHRAQGWLKVGYNFFIKRDGTVQVGRELMEGGAHAKGYNSKSVGVCLAGGVMEDGKTPENNYTPAQWASLEKLVRFLAEQFPKAKVIGHNDVAAKACPCFDAKEWWRGVS